ncbi:hypothetical protein QTN25_004524 [Entamoeba marina]
MLVYIDAFTGDEMYNDSYKIKQEGCMDVIEGRMVEKGNEDFGISCNVDEDAAEGAAADGLDSGVEKVIDVVDGAHLVEQEFTKSQYMAHVKGYMKRMVEHLTKNAPEKLDAFKVSATEFVKKVIGSFGDCSFYSGESMDVDNGCVVVCIYHDGITPTFYFFRDGMKEEKY